MNCKEFKQHIFDYLTDKNFDPELKEAMEDHYFDCDKCFDELELMSATIGAIHKKGVEELIENPDALIEKDLDLKPEAEKVQTLSEQKKKEMDVQRSQGSFMQALRVRDKIPDNIWKNIIHSFIDKYYPTEREIFDIAWRICKGIMPQDFRNETVAGSLAFVGNVEVETLKTPKLIIILNVLQQQKDLDEGSIRMIFKETGHILSCSEELINQFTDFILTSKEPLA